MSLMRSISGKLKLSLDAYRIRDFEGISEVLLYVTIDWIHWLPTNLRWHQATAKENRSNITDATAKELQAIIEDVLGNGQLLLP